MEKEVHHFPTFSQAATTDGAVTEGLLSLVREKPFVTSPSFLLGIPVRDIIWGAKAVVLKPGALAEEREPKAKHGGWEYRVWFLSDIMNLKSPTYRVVEW